jgi:hypothetical protein
MILGDDHTQAVTQARIGELNPRDLCLRRRLGERRIAESSQEKGNDAVSVPIHWTSGISAFCDSAILSERDA